MTGFGDFPISRTINPALTTIHVDFRALGRQTAELIFGLLAAVSGDTETIIDVGLSVVERASVGGKSKMEVAVIGSGAVGTALAGDLGAADSAEYVHLFDLGATRSQ